ncbi:MAG: ACP S-malonyltransferase [Phycisphaerales bacterium]|jgi:[acyl-carrier-protein] S-malonyltransferase|nr:ACP S-malonyltransferase [Phycisphaerales bacterium]
MKTAYLFPGQGAQKVGMGQDICEAFAPAAEIFERAEQITGMPIRKLCFEGPQELLDRTDNAQPCIFTVSAATLAVMNEVLSDQQKQEIAPTCLAGLSLGEYTALYAAGAVDFETALRLVMKRGQAMQAAAEQKPSSMLCVLGVDETQAAELCQAAAGGQVLTCANFNCPGQVVISGGVEACQRAAELAGEYGASGSVPLSVAGAFHSEYMAPAADDLAQALAGVSFVATEAPVISNVDAKPHAEPGQVAEKLLAQLVSPVRWQQSMEGLMEDGIEQFIEIGPGRVLAGLMRRIHRRVNFTSINSQKAVEKLAESN